VKRLIVCCDGTWDDADAGGSFSNVVRLSRAIKAAGMTRTGPIEQVVFYQAGVGTGSDLAMKLTGGAIGLGLSRNVRDAYAFLADNFCDGDELFLFGFSRGAYTARSIGGLIGWAGLLHKIDMDDFALLWESFKLRNRVNEPPDPRWKDARVYFPDRHDGVPIKCVGVWDTVGALGIPGHIGGLFQQFYNFQDTDLGNHVECAFQALAIDEHRRLYQPTLWTRAANAPAGQRIEQVWFAGAHTDVGGGYERHGLSDITLAWMVDRVSGMLDVDLAYVCDRQDRRNAWAQGPVHDSAAGLTGWFGRLNRPMMRTDSEAVHESVNARIQAGTAPIGGAYAPANLPPSPAYAALSLVEKDLVWCAAIPDHTGATGRPMPLHLHPVLLDLNSG
jgi:uncharacterized protein (DUF2235 family)